jgi:uncharacterized phiE125 gp8 family phage protein
MNFTEVTHPTAEPVSTTEAKLHVKVESDITTDDSLIAIQVKAARKWVERTYGLAIVFQAWDGSLDGFPWGEIQIPKYPLRAVSSITYHDEDLSTSTTFSSASYQVDKAKRPPVVVLKNGESWPTDSLRLSSGVVVRGKFGFAVPFTAATSDTITSTAHPFSNGDVVRVQNTGGALPAGLSADTDYYVIGATANTLQLSATSGGSAVDITDVGSGTNFLGEVPEDIKAAIKLLVGQMYAHREPEVTGTVVGKIGFAVDALLAPHRLWT